MQKNEDNKKRNAVNLDLTAFLEVTMVGLPGLEPGTNRL